MLQSYNKARTIVQDYNFNLLQLGKLLRSFQHIGMCMINTVYVPRLGLAFQYPEKQIKLKLKRLLQT